MCGGVGATNRLYSGGGIGFLVFRVFGLGMFSETIVGATVANGDLGRQVGFVVIPRQKSEVAAGVPTLHYGPRRMTGPLENFRRSRR